MGGPWEKYAPTQQPKGKPWERYSPPPMNAAPTELPEDQPHPDISWSQRAIVKNFAQSPETGAAYLNKEGFETEIKDGNIYVRKPGEKDFKALDPSGFDLQDITDMGYDVAAGVGTGVATAASGLAGAAATAPAGGVGAIPAAMAGGAASNAGLEALRQKFGQYMGIPQEVSGRDVAVSGAVGALSPVLFGTGATAGQIAKLAALKGMAPEVLAQTQRSMVTKGVEKAFPTIAAATSGKTTKAIQTYMARKPEVDALIQEGPDAAANVAEETAAQVKTAFFEKKRDVGQKMAVQIKGSDNLIPTSDLFTPLEDRYASLAGSQRATTPSGQAELEALRQEIDALKTGLPEQITPQTAWELQDRFKSMSDFQNLKGTFQSRYGKNASGAEKALSEAAADSYRVTNKKLNEAADTAGVKKEYSELSRLQEKLQKYFKDPEVTERTLMQLDKKSKGAVRKTVDELDKTVGNTDIRDTANILEAYSAFQNPELLPVSSGGTTSTSRTLSLSGGLEAFGGLFGEGGRKVGHAVGSVAGGPAAIKAAINVGKFASKAGSAPARIAPVLISPWERVQLKRQFEGER